MRPTVAAALLLSAFLVVPASAQAVRQSGTIDITDTFPYANPCTGETLLVERHVRARTQLVTDGNGGTHFSFNGHWQYRAVSETTGQTYVGSETGNHTVIFASGGTYTETYESVGHLVAKGRRDDLHIHTFTKMTVTPDGEVAVENVGQTIDCRG